LESPRRICYQIIIKNSLSQINGKSRAISIIKINKMIHNKIKANIFKITSLVHNNQIKNTKIDKI